jgi:hypothetical protein
MNVYIVVEGKQTEKQLYQFWLSEFVGSIRFLNNADDVDETHSETHQVYILASQGYPDYLTRIRDAAEDMTSFHWCPLKA